MRTQRLGWHANARAAYLSPQAQRLYADRAAAHARREQIAQMRHDGMAVTAIAAHFGISPGRVSNIVRDWRMTMNASRKDIIRKQDKTIERLRAALQQIADTDPSYDYDAAEQLREIARKALAR